jgi:hypothetical protein
VRVLLAVGDAVEDASIPSGVELLMRSASEVRVLSPTLVSRIGWLTGQIDESPGPDSPTPSPSSHPTTS